MSEVVTGKFVGYTHGGKEPTLYFDLGHYTQEHKKSGNVGWHPILEGCSIKRANITEVEYLEYKNAGTQRAQLGFIQKIITGTYQETEYSKRLMEVSFIKNADGSTRIRSFHLSRSKLIKPLLEGDEVNSNYSTKFNSIYIENVMKSAFYAKNSGLKKKD